MPDPRWIMSRPIRQKSVSPDLLLDVNSGRGDYKSQTENGKRVIKYVEWFLPSGGNEIVVLISAGVSIGKFVIYWFTPWVYRWIIHISGTFLVFGAGFVMDLMRMRLSKEFGALCNMQLNSWSIWVWFKLCILDLMRGSRKFFLSIYFIFTK